MDLSKVDSTSVFLTEQQRMIRDTARRLARDVIAPTAAERDRTGAWPRAELAALAEHGFMGMTIPQEYGGSETDFLGYCLAIEEIAAADAGVGTIVHVHNLGGALPIVHHGSTEQKRRLLPKMASGEKIGAFLITEPQAGSDTAGLRTFAKKDGDGFVINGTKQFISNGSEAGIANIIARTDMSAGKKGFTTFVVELPADGYVVSAIEDKHGQRTAHTAQIHLDGFRARAGDVLGEVGGGYAITLSGLSDGRIAIAAQAVGVAQAALDAAIKYAHEREVGGKPIFEKQAIAFRLAEMATQVDIARQYYMHAARLLEAGVPCAREAAIAKLFASEMAERVCSDGLQVHGGYGYLRSFPAERYCRDVRVCKIYEGTSDIQKLIISRNL
ncbi:MAG: acyl-CoA dehydrogenase family protein [Bradyrhizobium sp.]|uniref:acyl-CoA dehydrogenase family protein n=1 Tax=Bradyrhizobium sp. TaxID=376 RepID=UPI0025BB030D|nr:acyl-CoA dehydrogenase family protein [Bradyrhizobium sp.]MBI5261846.1 acyl-CoA dehydrogenase family protein [Bradyrhizobium sp.]